MIEINEADKPTVKKTIVVYSGRFQPFHRGHYASYQKLVSKFGENNVYIGRAGIVFIDKKRFPSKASPFCNPFKIGKDGDREEVLIKFKEYIMEKIKDPQLLSLS